LRASSVTYLFAIVGSLARLLAHQDLLPQARAMRTTAKGEITFAFGTVGTRMNFGGSEDG
jgi:hypothetical protein